MSNTRLARGLSPLSVLFLPLFALSVSAHRPDGPNSGTSKVERSSSASPLPGGRRQDDGESGSSKPLGILSAVYRDVRLDHLFSGISENSSAAIAQRSNAPGFSLSALISGAAPDNQANLHQGPNSAGGEMERLAGPPASTAPMTAGEKFHFYLARTFKPPEPYVLSIVSGLFQESFNAGNEKAGSYFVNSMADAGRNFAFRVTSNFFSHFAYATMFKQDPRFHRVNEGPTGKKIKQAIFRVFLTQDDHNERDEINYSFLLGNLSAAAISNVWEPRNDVGVGHTFERFGVSLGTKALRNLLEQYIGR